MNAVIDFRYLNCVVFIIEVHEMIYLSSDPFDGVVISYNLQIEITGGLLKLTEVRDFGSEVCFGVDV